MKQRLEALLREALRDAVASGTLRLPTIPPVLLEVPRDRQHGDLASNVALTVAREARTPPRAIAEAILTHLRDRDGILASSEVAGPGFLNFRFSPSFWRTCLLRAEGLATRMVSETLRLSQSEYVYRVVARECRLGEFRIPAGWLVRVCLRECHRRPDLFPEPERFDPDRFLDISQGKLIYAPFGHGEHSRDGLSCRAML